MGEVEDLIRRGEAARHTARNSDLIGGLTDALASATAEIEKLRADAEAYKRVIENKSAALLRPCISCGYEPKTIRPLESP